MLQATVPETTARPSGTRAFVLLLRGANVGGRNRVPMAVVVKALRDAGCDSVQTYIQSGNAVFHAVDAVAADAATAVGAAVAAQVGRTIPVILRTREEFSQAVRVNPFPDGEEDHRTVHVGFSDLRAAPERIAALNPQRSPPDEFRVQGREIYLRLPNGAARTKLTSAYFDSVLGTTTTFRNWRTVLKLLAMVTERDSRPHPS